MDFNEYQQLAARTDEARERNIDIIIGVMGMAGEAVEAMEHVKKWIEQGHKLNPDKIIEEAGDCLWYIAKTARALGISLEELATRNLDKLKARYPDGFSIDRSVNREREG